MVHWYDDNDNNCIHYNNTLATYYCCSLTNNARRTPSIRTICSYSLIIIYYKRDKLQLSFCNNNNYCCDKCQTMTMRIYLFSLRVPNNNIIRIGNEIDQVGTQTQYTITLHKLNIVQLPIYVMCCE